MLNLALQYALRCNITCGHCSVNAGPTVGRRMTLDFALDLLRQSESIDLIDRFTFTGGEVLLLKEDIVKLVAYATKVGKKTRIVSNGFWARHKDSGRRLLERLRRAGLTEINLSADEYHYDELPPYVTRHAVELLHEFGYAGLINRVEKRGGDTFDDFVAKCGLDPAQTVVMDPRLSVRQAEVLGRRKIVVRNIGLSIEGRGADRVDEATLIPLAQFPKVTCNQPVRAPSVTPEGLLFPCCAPGSNYPTFQVGNLHERPLAELIQRLLDDPLAAFITKYGPPRLMQLLARRDPAFDRPYTDVCNMCCSALRRYTGDELRAVVQEFHAEQWLTSLFGFKREAAS